MSRKKTSKFQADPPPKKQPFMTPERKKVYILMAIVDGALFLGIALVALFRFLPLYPTAPILAGVAVIFNYALMFVKRDVLMGRK